MHVVLSIIFTIGLCALGHEATLQMFPCRFGGMEVEVKLSPIPPEKLRGLPQKGEGDLWYGSITLGNGADTTITMAVWEGPEGPYVWLDGDNDEDLSDEGPGHWEWHKGWERFLWRYRVNVEYRENGRDLHEPYLLRIMARPNYDAENPPWYTYSICPGSHRRGVIDLDGKNVLIAIGEADFDGVFTPEELWVAVDTDNDGKISFYPYEIFRPGEPVHLDKTLYEVAFVSPSGSYIRLRPIGERPHPLPILSVGRVFPDLEAKDISGKDFSLAELRGRIVALFFVQESFLDLVCKGDGTKVCRNQWSHVCHRHRSIAEFFSDDPQVKVVVVLTDGEPPRLEKWRDPDLSWIVIWAPWALEDYRVGTQAFVIDEAGVIRYSDELTAHCFSCWACPRYETSYASPLDILWAIRRLKEAH